jgi:hypothetical protein
MDSLVPALQQRLRSAVEAEQQHEAAAIKALYARSSLNKLERDGLVLLRLTAAPHTVLYSSMVWRFSLAWQQHAEQQQQLLPTHRFRQGDSLLVSRFGADQAAALGSSNGNSNGSSSSSLNCGLGGPASSSPADLQPDAQGFRPLDATVLEVG